MAGVPFVFLDQRNKYIDFHIVNIIEFEVEWKKNFYAIYTMYPGYTNNMTNLINPDH